MPRDPRPFVFLHDGFCEHPKIEPLSDRAFRLIVSLICYSGRNLTDGYLSTSVWARRGTPRARQELLAAGLVEVVDDQRVVVHDYLQHNRSRVEVEESRANKASSGTKGNHERWHAARGVVDQDCEHCRMRSGTDRSSDRGRDGRSDRETYRETSLEVEVEEEKEKRSVETDLERAPFVTPASEREPRPSMLLQPDRAPEPPPPDPAPDAAGPAASVVEAYVAAAKVVGQPNPGPKLRARIGRSAIDLLAEGHSLELITVTARNAAAVGWHDLEIQMQRDAAEARGAGRLRSRSTTDDRVRQGLEVAAQMRALDEADAVAAPALNGHAGPPEPALPRASS